MLKRLYRGTIDFIKSEYKSIIILMILYIILNYPVNYYIIVGGGTDNIESRISVENKYESKGSFNLSYVEELKGTILTYALSYIIPTFEREDANDYKYTNDESIEDIEFRGDLDLKVSNENSKYWAYTLAGKEVSKKSSKIYVIFISKDFEVPLKVGDEILSIDNISFNNLKEFQEIIQTKNENDNIIVKVLRNNSEKELTCTIHKEEDRLILGIGVEQYNIYDTNPKIDIKFNKRESGSSGGLITTLEIYNQLTKKDLTKGKKIVGTGTIELDGTIGQIGGIEHKLLGAEKAKADLFLVPSGQNYEDAIKYKKDKKLKTKIVEIKTIEDAIKYLKDNN